MLMFPIFYFITDENDPDLRHSWPAFRKCREEEDIALSPLPQSLEMNQ